MNFQNKIKLTKRRLNKLQATQNQKDKRFFLTFASLMKKKQGIENQTVKRVKYYQCRDLFFKLDKNEVPVPQEEKTQQRSD